MNDKNKPLSKKTTDKYKSLLKLYLKNENLEDFNKTYINLHYKIALKNQQFISKETNRSCLSAIIWYLKTYYSNKKNLINEYSLLLTHMRKSCLFDTKNNLNVKQNNIMFWDDIIKIRDKYKKEVNEVLKGTNIIIDGKPINRNLSLSDKSTIRKYLVSCVYTYQPPRRTLDYMYMVVIPNYNVFINLKKKNKDYNNHNYYCYKEGWFIFCFYKTRAIYGIQAIKVDETLNNIIKSYINIMDISTTGRIISYTNKGEIIEYKRNNNKTFNIINKSNPNKYIVDYINKNNIKVNNKIFKFDLLFKDKNFLLLVRETFKCGVNVLRHSYINFIYNNLNFKSKKENISNILQQLSNKMAHSLPTNLGYFKTNEAVINKINNNKLVYIPSSEYIIDHYNNYNIFTVNNKQNIKRLSRLLTDLITFLIFIKLGIIKYKEENKRGKKNVIDNELDLDSVIPSLVNTTKNKTLTKSNNRNYKNKSKKKDNKKK